MKLSVELATRKRKSEGSHSRLHSSKRKQINISDDEGDDSMMKGCVIIYC